MLVIPNIFGAFLGAFILLGQTTGVPVPQQPIGNSTVQIRMYSGGTDSCGSSNCQQTSGSCCMFPDFPAWFQCCCCNDNDDDEDDNDKPDNSPNPNNPAAVPPITPNIPATSVNEPDPKTQGAEDSSTPSSNPDNTENMGNKKKKVRVIVGKGGVKTVEYANMYSSVNNEDNETVFSRAKRAIAHHKQHTHHTYKPDRAHHTHYKHHKHHGNKHLLKSTFSSPEQIECDNCDPTSCLGFNEPDIRIPLIMAPDPHPMLPEPYIEPPNPRPAPPCPCDDSGLCGDSKDGEEPHVPLIEEECIDENLAHERSMSELPTEDSDCERCKKMRKHRGRRLKRHPFDKLDFKIQQNFTEPNEPIKKVFELNATLNGSSQRIKRDTNLTPESSTSADIKHTFNVYVDNDTNTKTEIFVDSIKVPLRRKRATNDTTTIKTPETQPTTSTTTKTTTSMGTTTPVIIQSTTEDPNLKVVPLEQPKDSLENMNGKLYYSNPLGQPPAYNPLPTWAEGFFPQLPPETTEDPLLEKLFHQSKQLEENGFKTNKENVQKIEPRFFTNTPDSQSDEPQEMKMLLAQILGENVPDIESKQLPSMTQTFENSLKFYEYLDELLKSDTFDKPKKSSNKYFEEIIKILINSLRVKEGPIDENKAEKLLESIKNFIKFIVISGKQSYQIVSDSHLENITKICLGQNHCQDLDSDVVKNIIINKFNQSMAVFTDLYHKISSLPNCMSKTSNCLQETFQKVYKLIIYSGTVVNNIFLNTELYLMSLNCDNKCSKLFKLELNNMVKKYELKIINSHKKIHFK